MTDYAGQEGILSGAGSLEATESEIPSHLGM